MVTLTTISISML